MGGLPINIREHSLFVCGFGKKWFFSQKGRMPLPTRYKLVKKIATGGMAEIYLGKQTGEDGFERLCAIKRILPHYATESEYIAMFRDEAHICKRLQQANIVRVEGFEEVEGSYAIIMEFVYGTDLRSVLVACEKAKTRLDIPMIVYIAAETARGLHYAHSKVDEITGKALDIVHRDISPQNILVSYQGEVKVTDFGIADAESKITETRPGIVKGKYSYMSPEQILGKQVDARTDVFALGIVLWEMLLMKRLFHADNEVLTINLVRNCKIPQNLRELNPSVEPELEDIVYRSLTKEPSKRYQSMRELEKDLRAYLSRRYPDFSASDLSKFLLEVLADKKAETEEAIRNALSQGNPQKASPVQEIKPQQETPGKKLDPKNQPRIKFKEPELSLGSNFGSPNLAQNQQAHLSSVRQRAINTGGSMPSSGTNVAGRRSRSRTQKSRINKSGIALVLLFGFVLVTASYVVKLASKSHQNDPVQLILRTTPKVVKLKLGGQELFGGNYLNTQRRGIRLPPNKVHTLTISREGYNTEKIKISGEPGQVIRKTDLVLTPAMSFAPVKISLSDPSITHKFYFDVNSGFVAGTIPASLVDLAYGRPYQLRVYYDETKRKKLLTCNFIPRARSWRAPYRVKINIRKKSCD